MPTTFAQLQTVRHYSDAGSSCRRQRVVAAVRPLTLMTEAPVITSSARLYEGARLIAGNGGEPIEDAAFLVDDGVIVALGGAGSSVSRWAPGELIWQTRRSCRCWSASTGIPGISRA